MQYLVIYANGKSQSFYNESVAKMYCTINGGFIVNLLDTESENETEIENELS